jgi:hypothetical protein
MKISAKTRNAITRFITNPRLVEKSNIDYSASLIYNIDCFPRLLYRFARKIENGVRAVSLNIIRNGVCSVANPCEALLKSCGNQISRFSIRNKIYYIGCGCIFNNEFEPILLTYITTDTLFARLQGNDVSVIFINNAYVNNDNIFNNFLSKKIIPVLFEQTMEIRLLDPLRINRLVIKPNNIELTKEAYWSLIINKQ